MVSLSEDTCQLQLAAGKDAGTTLFDAVGGYMFHQRKNSATLQIIFVVVGDEDAPIYISLIPRELSGSSELKVKMDLTLTLIY